MSVGEYDVVFVGCGLAAGLLLRELRGALPGRVAVVDPRPLAGHPNVHWSYWSAGKTPYDRHAIGAWGRARVGEGPPEPVAPFTLRLVRSGDVLAGLAGDLRPLPVDWIPEEVGAVRGAGELYEVSTGAGVLRARWVFDSAPDVEPTFPAAARPAAAIRGTEVRVLSDRPVFDATAATLFDPLDGRSFAYLLPLGAREALVESAAFGPAATGSAPLLSYLGARYPGAGFEVVHEEDGAVPLGFAPRRTAGPRHVLLGAKRGLVKPSAGYGVLRIAGEGEALARLWRRGLPLPPVRRVPARWAILDAGFLGLARTDPRLPRRLLGNVMGAVPVTDSLRFIDEDLPPWRLARVFLHALPAVLRGVLRKG